MSSRIGAMSELFFAAEALKRKFKLYQPVGNYSAYDFIVRSGTKFSKVQIKGASKMVGGRYKFNAHHGAARRQYTPDEVDFLVLHIQPSNDWLIIPMDKVTCADICIGVKSKYWEFNAAWILLEDSEGQKASFDTKSKKEKRKKKRKNKKGGKK